ncbi:MAG: PhnD/SsuA/transferrin family substrate-binding protein [Acidobacteria bacterium]|nr:PhnD/SsuA/transferrin family substrate-binding protein [Acidobacteriota bacterium]
MLPLILGLLGATFAAPEASAPLRLVACAPGYPGTTEQAQPTMDEFARLIEAAADWDAGTLAAEYHEDEVGGLARLRDPDTQVALVPLPLFFKYEAELGLRPIAQTLGPGGTAHERWSLVASTGRVKGPGDLEGWTIAGVPGYADSFVRGNLLRDWGALPKTATIEFTPRVLGALRRAMQGDDVAVILDRSQVEAMDSLPNAADLEVIATAPEMSMGLVVSVGDRLDADTSEALRRALLRVHHDAQFGELLEMVRINSFGPVDDAMVMAGRQAFHGAS